MQTVAEIPTARKPQAFYATLYDVAGVITKPHANVLFLDTTSGAVVTLTPADSAALVVLGAVETAMAQYIADMARGGAARIACVRLQPRTQRLGLGKRRCIVCNCPDNMVEMKLCDGPALRGKGTCDSPVCVHHAAHVDPDRDYCPRHAGQAVP